MRGLAGGAVAVCYHRAVPCSCSHFSLALNRWTGEWGLGFVGRALAPFLFGRIARLPFDQDGRCSLRWISLGLGALGILSTQAYARVRWPQQAVDRASFRRWDSLALVLLSSLVKFSFGLSFLSCTKPWAGCVLLMGQAIFRLWPAARSAQWVGEGWGGGLQLLGRNDGPNSFK
jgi:hypothetical protein